MLFVPTAGLINSVVKDAASLPFTICTPGHGVHKNMSLEEAIKGDYLMVVCHPTKIVNMCAGFDEFDTTTQRKIGLIEQHEKNKRLLRDGENWVLVSDECHTVVATNFTSFKDLYDITKTY